MKECIFIENNQEALRIIIENINDCKLENKSRAYKNDVLRAIEILSRKNEKFDIIFMDPPYKENLTEKTLMHISDFSLLDDDGIVISEHSIYEKIPDIVGKLVKYDERDYNKKIISFYKYNL